MRKAVHLEMREAVAAWRNGAGVSRVLARARLVMKAAVSSLQRPPANEAYCFRCAVATRMMMMMMMVMRMTRKRTRMRMTLLVQKGLGECLCPVSFMFSGVVQQQWALFLLCGT